MSLVLAGVASGSVKKGDVELEILGGLGHGERSRLRETIRIPFWKARRAADLDGWLVSGGIGRFVSDNLQLAVVGFGSWMDGSETASLVIDPEIPEALQVYEARRRRGRLRRRRSRSDGTSRPRSPLVPYLGVQALWATADVDISGTAVRVRRHTAPHRVTQRQRQRQRHPVGTGRRSAAASWAKPTTCSSNTSTISGPAPSATSSTPVTRSSSASPIA